MIANTTETFVYKLFCSWKGNEFAAEWHLDYGSGRPLESLASADRYRLPQVFF